MSNLRRSLPALMLLALPTACADPCIDDGLGQANEGTCPTLNSASDTEGATESATESNSNTMTVSDSLDTTETMSGSQSGTITDSESDGETMWCVDADGDGFGDPDMCTSGGDMPPGTVDNDDDCDDSNPDTFPGAAPNDDPEACMQDEDGDDWGDDDPPPGVDPGTDCDDSDADTFPGAAENEDPPDECMTDADGDGWGDCYDANPQLNPDTVQLTAFLPYQGIVGASRTIQVVDETDATFSPFVQLGTPMGGIPNVNIVTATFNEQMEVYANDLTSVRLHTVDYADTCGENLGVVEPVSMMPYGPMGDVVCGLEFGEDGMLYGIGQNGDDLRIFDPMTGQISDSTIVTVNGGLVDIASCGMARDCSTGRLLIANGFDRTIYTVDPATAEAEVLRDLSDFFDNTWLPTGLEYDPVTHTALLSTGDELYRINLDDDTVDPELIGMFEEEVSNLQHLPICM